MIGMILKGRYFVLEPLGQGGQGQLYLAKDMEMGIYRAVKEIPAERKKEAKLLRLMEHPGIPRMIDYIERQNACYLVMEYIRGKNLTELKKSGKRFSADELIRIGMEIAHVLDYMHHLKPTIIHGDVKPENIMLSEAGKIYLVDYGSCVACYEKETKSIMGTKEYAAPEQFQGRSSIRSDIYNLGKTLRELAGANSLAGSVKLFVNNPVLYTGLLKCTSRQEKYRFHSMRDVASMLLKAKGENYQKRHLVLAGAAAVVLLLAIATLLFTKDDQTKKSLTQTLTSVTDVYYEALGDSNLCAVEGTVRKKQKESEKELRSILKELSEPREKQQIYMQLAAYCEMNGEMEKADLYYQQLLLENPADFYVYEEYGAFLWRCGNEKESLNLWEQYCNMRGKAVFPDHKWEACKMECVNGDWWRRCIYEKESASRK
ncbi:MAG: protein kinase [Blautia sp.]|nr:protein kinase [Blautia sp.]